MNPTEFGVKYPTLDGHGIPSSIYRCLAGDFFNRYYDDGVDDVL
jgi:hypothetical protein